MYSVCIVAIQLPVDFASRVCRNSHILPLPYEHFVRQAKIPSWRDARLSNYFHNSRLCCRILWGKPGIFPLITGSKCFLSRPVKKTYSNAFSPFRRLYRQHEVSTWGSIRSEKLQFFFFYRNHPLLATWHGDFSPLVCCKPVLGKFLSLWKSHREIIMC